MPAPLRRQLCALFAAEWPELRLALQTARDAGDRATLQSRAHYLKNSADVLGDDELRELCHRLQDAAQAGNEATAPRAGRRHRKAGTRLAKPPKPPPISFRPSPRTVSGPKQPT
jgi:HPt (histidine-containing phosphotransfer) domain-containing protein